MVTAKLTASEPSPSHADRRAIVLATVLLVHALMTIDIGTMLAGLPAIRDALHGDAAQMQLLIAAYSLAWAVTLITGGRLGDLYGRRRILLIGSMGFTAAATLSALASDGSLLIGARFVAGLCAALTAPQVFAIIQVTYPPVERARPLGLIGAVSGIAMMVGQVGAGVILRVDPFGAGWRVMFVYEAILGLIVLAAVARVVPESRATTRGAIDVVGAVVLAVGLGLVVYPLIIARSSGWSAWVWFALALAAPVLLLFVRHERSVGSRGVAPLIDLSLYRFRSFAAGSAIGSVYWLTHAPSSFLFILIAQDGLGLSPLSSALWYGAVCIPFFFGSRHAARLVTAIGRRAVFVFMGCAVAGATIAGTTALVRGADLSIWQLAPGLAIQGYGQGAHISLFVNFSLQDVSSDYAGAAAGAVSTFQQVSASIGLALLGLVYFETLRGSGTASHAHSFGVTSIVFVAALGIVVLCLAPLLPAHPRERTPVTV